MKSSRSRQSRPPTRVGSRNNFFSITTSSQIARQNENQLTTTETASRSQDLTNCPAQGRFSCSVLFSLPSSLDGTREPVETNPRMGKETTEEVPKTHEAHSPDGFRVWLECSNQNRLRKRWEALRLSRTTKSSHERTTTIRLRRTRMVRLLAVSEMPCAKLIGCDAGFCNHGHRPNQLARIKTAASRSARRKRRRRNRKILGHICV